jgi:acyl-CoA thioester hydrolase
MATQKLQLIINPRFCETDALGHINNAVYLNWCEEARIPIFKIFTPDLDIKKWRLIIARNDISYKSPAYFGKSIVINTWVGRLGNSSIILEHEVVQEQVVVAHCQSTLVHFDYQLNKSRPIPEAERQSLSFYLLPAN